MFMIKRYCIILGLLCLLSPAAYCEQASSPSLDVAGQKLALGFYKERRLAYGKKIYEQACASCHDEGVDGAPAQAVDAAGEYLLSITFPELPLD